MDPKINSQNSLSDFLSAQIKIKMKCIYIFKKNI